MRHTHVEMGFSAAEIIARRLPMIWWGVMSPTAASKAEMSRMVVEKQMAFAESCLAVQAEFLRMMLAPWTPASTDRLMQAALAPSAGRVRSNVRRLRR